MPQIDVLKEIGIKCWMMARDKHSGSIMMVIDDRGRFIEVEELRKMIECGDLIPRELIKEAFGELEFAGWHGYTTSEDEDTGKTFAIIEFSKTGYEAFKERLLREPKP